MTIKVLIQVQSLLILSPCTHRIKMSWLSRLSCKHSSFKVYILSIFMGRQVHTEYI